MEGYASNIPSCQKPREISFNNEIIECFAGEYQKKAYPDIEELPPNQSFRFKALVEKE